MKKALLPILLAATCFTAATAQTEKGNVLVGANIANVSAAMQKGGDAIDFWSISINPRAGFFLQKNFALGASIGLGYSKSGPAESFSYSIEPFARYYFGSKKTRLFGEAGIGYYGSHVDGFPGGFDNSGFMFTIGPGLAHFLNENVSLETSLLLQGVHSSEVSEITYNPTLSFGFQVYLRGCKHKAKEVSKNAVDSAAEDKDEE